MKSWSNRQGTPAMSSAEAGYCAMVRACVERARDMEVLVLWLQDVVMQKRLELKEVCGKKNPAEKNPADILTTTQEQEFGASEGVSGTRSFLCSQLSTHDCVK